jgi:hypothetical protein
MGTNWFGKTVAATAFVLLTAVVVGFLALLLLPGTGIGSYRIC